MYVFTVKFRHSNINQATPVPFTADVTEKNSLLTQIIHYTFNDDAQTQKQRRPVRLYKYVCSVIIWKDKHNDNSPLSNNNKNWIKKVYVRN